MRQKLGPLGQSCPRAIIRTDSHYGLHRCRLHIDESATGSRILASCLAQWPRLDLFTTKIAPVTNTHIDLDVAQWNGLAGNEMVEQSSPTGTGIAKGLPVVAGMFARLAFTHPSAYCATGFVPPSQGQRLQKHHRLQASRRRCWTHRSTTAG